MRSEAGRLSSTTRVLTPFDRAVYLLLTALWIFVNFKFWTWWPQRAAAGDPYLAISVSAALAYQVTVLPTIFWLYVGKMRRPRHIVADTGQKVAVITLCVPSMESVDVIEAQLKALAEIRYPHDSWILDEGDCPHVRWLAEEYGIRYFTRKGIARWNQPGPPHQAKTKAGNVNAWLDHLDQARIDYDAFVQLDIDHRPEPNYLDRVLGHLKDPEVAWVQAPSVYGNLDTWTSRGLVEQDLALQGPLQMGFYGATRTPFIIGSHTTYRMSAVREIGGFQPTRAEDHLDTVVLAAHGYRGVFVPELIATGDGPTDLGTYLRQQFAWARSMITVLFTRMPQAIRGHSPTQAFQFLFAQTWYPLWSLSLLTVACAPPIAVITDGRIADTRLVDYLVFFAPIALLAWVMWNFTRRFQQPAGIRLSWRAAVLAVARWPAVLWALLSVIFRIDRPYMVTPKGKEGAKQVNLGGLLTHGPLAAFATLAVAAPWIADAIGGGVGSQSYVALTLFTALAPIGSFATGLLIEVQDERSRLTAIELTRRDGPLLVWLALLTLAFAATTVHYWEPIAGVLG